MNALSIEHDTQCHTHLTRTSLQDRTRGQSALRRQLSSSHTKESPCTRCKPARPCLPQSGTCNCNTVMEQGLSFSLHLETSPVCFHFSVGTVFYSPRKEVEQRHHLHQFLLQPDLATKATAGPPCGRYPRNGTWKECCLSRHLQAPVHSFLKMCNSPQWT